MQDGDVVHARERVGMLWAEHLLSERERLPVYPFGLAVLALAAECVGDVVHAVERVGMLWAEHLLSECERLPVYPFGLAVFALMIECVGDVKKKTFCLSIINILSMIQSCLYMGQISRPYISVFLLRKWQRINT